MAAAVARTAGVAIPDLLLLHNGVTSPLWEVLHLCLGREELEEHSLCVHGDTITERGESVFRCLE